MEKLRYERPVITTLNAGITNKFGTKSLHAPTNSIDGVAVRSLVQEYGSPLFIISERKIRQTYRDAYRAFATRYPKVQFAWSYKTNYLNAVCNVFHQEGAWAEVVSVFEFQKALKNGVAGRHILFNGPDKTDKDLTLAISHGSVIHIDHLDELYQIMELSEREDKRPRVAIRVNMDTGIYPMWDRFGFNYESGQAWDAINKILLTDKLDLVGLHCHIGTFMLSANAYAIAAGKLADLALGIFTKHNKTVEYIDLGGGFASKNTLRGSYLPGSDVIPGFDDYAEAICSTLLNAGFNKDNLPLLILETGRALIDEAGYLAATVIANKRLSDGRRAVIMDAGVNILFTSFWYEHRISPVEEGGTHTETAIVYGPLCMNIDVIRESVTLPPLKKGDLVVIHTVGAYNMTQWMQFISMRPNVVMIDEDSKVHLIRSRETVDDLNNKESVPAHLKSFNLG
ncbi:MAG: alanine racemase [Bacteroidia bacterium]